jgi:hypothetical protein
LAGLLFEAANVRRRECAAQQVNARESSFSCSRHSLAQMSATTGDPSNSEDNAPAGSGSGSPQRSDERNERSGQGRPSGGRGDGPAGKDLSKEELKTKLQRKRWGSRLRGLTWLFLIAMNLYLAYLIVSMVT